MITLFVVCVAVFFGAMFLLVAHDARKVRPVDKRKASQDHFIRSTRQHDDDLKGSR